MIGLLVLVPMLVLHGEMGAFLPPLVLSYAAAVVASMLVALTFTPALGALVLTRRRQSRPRSSDGSVPRYERVLSRFGRSVAPGRHRGRRAPRGWGSRWLPCSTRTDSLVPDFKDRNLLVQLDGAPGTRFPRCAGSRPEQEPSSAHCPV